MAFNLSENFKTLGGKLGTCICKSTKVHAFAYHPTVSNFINFCKTDNYDWLNKSFVSNKVKTKALYLTYITGLLTD